MTRIRTIIIDDEPLARDGIRMLLSKDEQFEIIAECADGKESISAIRKLMPDLVFLDVQMPETDGFGVLRALTPQQLPMVVFVTAFDKFAIDAFEAHALDYILKPINPARFSKSLRRIKERFSEKHVGELSKRLLGLLKAIDPDSVVDAGSNHLTRFSVKTGDRIRLIDAADVDWIEAEDYYVKLHVGKQAHLLRDTLTRLEQELDPKLFLRIHRSTIVNTSRIKELKQQFRGEYFVILKDSTKLKLSRTHHKAVAKILSGR